MKLLKKGMKPKEMTIEISVRSQGQLYLNAFAKHFPIGHYVYLYQSEDRKKLILKPSETKEIYGYKIQHAGGPRGRDKPQIRPLSIIKYLGLKRGRYLAEWDDEKQVLTVFI